MTDRGLSELDRRTVFKHRYYEGSVLDVFGHGYDGIWQVGNEPTFKRKFGQVTALDFGPGTTFIGVDDVPFDASQEFSIEVLLRARSAGHTLFGRIFGHSGGGIKEVHFNGSEHELVFDCGAVLAVHDTFVGDVDHFVFLRDRSSVGYIYLNSQLIGSGAVGDNAGTGALSIGTMFADCFDGSMFLFRMFDDALSEDEVSRLYEASRIRLWPGAQRRSGIVSAL